jgi:hypothetical protein
LKNFFENPCSLADNSEKMTQKAGNLLGLANGGKTATGTVPGGARADAARLELGRLPPPSWPG